MLSGLPFITRQWFAFKPREGAVAKELDAGAVHQQVQRPIGTPIGNLDGQRLLPPTQGRIIWHSPIQVRHLEQAVHHPGRLPQRQLEQNFDRQACVDTPACASDFVISMIK